MKTPIQVLMPKFRIDETLEEIRECLEKGWTGIGFKTVHFEEKWKEMTALKNAHFLNSATSGLHLALNIFKSEGNWLDGDEIITTPLTFVSTNHAILYEKLTPVFADIDEFMCVSPTSIEQRITERTRAVMFVGIGGNVGRLREVKKLCKKHGLKLILDAAHMTGTRWTDTMTHVGLESDVAVFSFQAVKNLPSADSGMICFKDAELDKKARELSWLGINKTTYDRFSKGKYKWYYEVDELGFKYHGNSVIAAMCLVALKYLDEDNERRRNICKQYDHFFADFQQIHRIPVSTECLSSRHLYQVLVPNRDIIIQKMQDANISLGVHYRNNQDYSLYSSYLGHCPVAHHSSKELLSLPLHLNISDADIEEISMKFIEVVKEVCA